MNYPTWYGRWQECPWSARFPWTGEVAFTRLSGAPHRRGKSQDRRGTAPLAATCTPWHRSYCGVSALQRQCLRDE